MFEFFLSTLVTALSLLVVDMALPGVDLNNFAAALLAALVIGFVNNTIRPVLSLLSLPITFLTLGAFSLVVNGICFWLASVFAAGFEVHGPLAFFVGPVILSLATMVLNHYFEKHGVDSFWLKGKNESLEASEQ